MYFFAYIQKLVTLSMTMQQLMVIQEHLMTNHHLGYIKVLYMIPTESQVSVLGKKGVVCFIRPQKWQFNAVFLQTIVESLSKLWFGLVLSLFDLKNISLRLKLTACPEKNIVHSKLCPTDKKL